MPITHICETGQLPLAADALFTATEPCSVFVSVNCGATQRDVQLYVNTGTRRRFIALLPLMANASWPPNAPYGPIALNTGDSIDGQASAAAEVNWVITGHGIT